MEVSSTGTVVAPANAVLPSFVRSFRLLPRQGPPQRMATDLKLISDLHFAVLPGPRERGAKTIVIEPIVQVDKTTPSPLLGQD